MKVSGSQTLPEGKIDEELVTSGSTKINGNFECNGFKSSGSLKGSGDLIIHGDFKSSGSFKLEGSLSVDGDARSPGSTTINGEVQIIGRLRSSGSFKAGKQVAARDGVKISGSSKIQGNLLSNKDVNLRGATIIEGNIKADNILIGMPIDILRPWRPYKVHGNIVAENDVDVTKTIVKGDIKGRDVKIGIGTEVEGEVYYINSIEVSPRASLAKKPIQIEF